MSNHISIQVSPEGTVAIMLPGTNEYTHLSVSHCQILLDELPQKIERAKQAYLHYHKALLAAAGKTE